MVEPPACVNAFGVPSAMGWSHSFAEASLSLTHSESASVAVGGRWEGADSNGGAFRGFGAQLPLTTSRHFLFAIATFRESFLFWHFLRWFVTGLEPSQRDHTVTAFEFPIGLDALSDSDLMLLAEPLSQICCLASKHLIRCPSTQGGIRHHLVVLLDVESHQPFDRAEAPKRMEEEPIVLQAPKPGLDHRVRPSHLNLGQ